MIGISVPNPLFAKLERAVEAGGIMVLVDIQKEKTVALLDYMRLNHLEIRIYGAQLSKWTASDE